MGDGSRFHVNLPGCICTTIIFSQKWPLGNTQRNIVWIADHRMNTWVSWFYPWHIFITICINTFVWVIICLKLPEKINFKYIHTTKSQLQNFSILTMRYGWFEYLGPGWVRYRLWWMASASSYRWFFRIRPSLHNRTTCPSPCTKSYLILFPYTFPIFVDIIVYCHDMSKLSKQNYIEHACNCSILTVNNVCIQISVVST